MSSQHNTIPCYDPLRDAPLEDTQYYLFELSCIPPMSEAEYHDVARRIRQARAGLLDPATGAQARERMIAAHLSKVVAIAKHRHAATIEPKISLLDLIQEGNAALVKLVDEFPFSEEKHLGGYAHKHITWAILAALYASHTIRVPDSSYRYAREKGQAGDLVKLRQIVSIDEPCTSKRGKSHGEEVTMLQFLSTPAETARVCDQIKAECVQLLLSRLVPREREALQCRYGLGDEETGYTLEETAQRMNVTASMVCQYERRGMAKIRAIYQAYEREAGQELDYFCADRAFLAYLQEQGTHDQPTPTALPLDLESVRRLDAAYVALVERGCSISVRSLSKEARINTTRAGEYLKIRRHFPQTERPA